MLSEQRKHCGATGVHTVWPNPTSSGLISSQYSDGSHASSACAAARACGPPRAQPGETAWDGACVRLPRSARRGRTRTDHVPAVSPRVRRRQCWCGPNGAGSRCGARGRRRRCRGFCRCVRRSARVTCARDARGRSTLRSHRRCVCRTYFFHATCSVRKAILGPTPGSATSSSSVPGMSSWYCSCRILAVASRYLRRTSAAPAACASACEGAAAGGGGGARAHARRTASCGCESRPC